MLWPSEGKSEKYHGILKCQSWLPYIKTTIFSFRRPCVFFHSLVYIFGVYFPIYLILCRQWKRWFLQGVFLVAIFYLQCDKNYTCSNWFWPNILQYFVVLNMAFCKYNYIRTRVQTRFAHTYFSLKLDYFKYYAKLIQILFWQRGQRCTFDKKVFWWKFIVKVWVTSQKYSSRNIPIHCIFPRMFALEICDVQFSMNTRCQFMLHEHKYNCSTCMEYI